MLLVSRTAVLAPLQQQRELLRGHRRLLLVLVLLVQKQVLTVACTGGTMRVCWTCQQQRPCTCRAS
jgi:hypothetical protein